MEGRAEVESEARVLGAQVGALGACCRAEEEGEVGCGCSGPGAKGVGVTP